MSIEKVISIVNLMKEINTHKDVKRAISEVCEDGVSSKFICGDVDNIPMDLTLKIRLLKETLDRELINVEGQHSSTYHLLAGRDDVQTLVFEQDSFGPLIVGVKLRHADWWITYG